MLLHLQPVPALYGEKLCGKQKADDQQRGHNADIPRPARPVREDVTTRRRNDDNHFQLVEFAEVIEPLLTVPARLTKERRFMSSSEPLKVFSSREILVDLGFIVRITQDHVTVVLQERDGAARTKPDTRQQVLEVVEP